MPATAQSRLPAVVLRSMKPERIALDGASDIDDVVRRVVRTRLGEVRKLAAGLELREKQRLHHFRIACKRLRYALERFDAVDPSLGTAAKHLSHMQDVLGEAHDRDVLLEILPPTMQRTRNELQLQRERCVEEAMKLWQEFDAIAISPNLNRPLIALQGEHSLGGGNE